MCQRFAREIFWISLLVTILGHKEIWYHLEFDKMTEFLKKKNHINFQNIDINKNSLPILDINVGNNMAKFERSSTSYKALAT